MKLKNLFKIDPLKSFTELPILWFTIFFLFLVAFCIAFFIVLNSNIEITYDYKGVNLLIEVFKVPLSILAIIITIVVILAATHRSAQTKEQIINTNKQNAFSNYYKHIEEFEKYMHAIKNKAVIFENLRLTHKYLFPNSIEGNYNAYSEFLNVIEFEFNKIKNLLKKFNQDREETVFTLLYEIYKGIDYCFSLLHINIGRSGTQIVQEGLKIVVPTKNIKDIINQIQNSSLFLIQLLSFDHGVLIPNSLKQVANLTISVVPEWDFPVREKFENFILLNDEE